MSFENVPCASPDTDGQEEPAPSLYGLDHSHEDKIRSMKKTSAPPRLAETANIEDHVIMNEEEIAQVRESVSLIGRREMYGENRSLSSEKKDEVINERKPYPRERWIDLNLPNTKRNGYGGDSRSNNAEVPMNEFAERSASVIKRTTHEGISPDNESGKLRGVEKEYLKLHCTEKLGNDASSVNTRGYYYKYPHEEMKTLPHGVRESKEEYDSDGERASQKTPDQRVVPRVYYMQHPNSVGMTHGGHLLHTRFADNRFIHPSQRGDYAANRPEQQVPVANSPGDSNEHGNRFNGISGHGGMQFVDRQAFMQQGFAVLPGIGPVRVVDGMYYSTIPMGHDSNHYENFGAVPTYVPGVQSDVAALHQRQANVGNTGTVNTESATSHGQHNQDKKTNNNPFGAQNHAKPTSPLPEEVKQNETQTVVKAERDSPAPPSYEEVEKKTQTIKHKGRARPLPGSKPEIKCEQCGKIFGSSSALAKHKLTHSDERRYVCPICSKGFKRQDHLNGHMVTHRDKKPYECSFQDCDKSYCDMRSLRRHLENHHANGQTGGDANSRTASPALTVSEPSSSNTTPVNETPRVVFKPSRGRPPKDRSLKFEGHDGGESESGKSSGTSTPGSTHEVVVVRDQATMVASRERSSDSFSSTGSEDVTQVEKHTETRPTSLAVPVDDAKKHTAVDMLKQAAERAQEQRDKQNVERFPQQQQYILYPDGTVSYPPQWYQASVFAGQDPRLNAVYQYPQIFAPQVYHHGTPMIINNPNMQRHAMSTRVYAEGDKPTDQTKQSVGGIKVTQRSPSVEFPQASTPQGQFARQQGQQTAGTPTDPTAIALATAKERGQQLFSREGYYGIHPSGTLWQQVRYDDSSTPYIKQENNAMGNTKTSFTHVRSPSNSSTSSEIDGDNSEHFQRGMHYAPGVRSDSYDRKNADTNYSKKDNSFHHVPEGKSPSEEQKNDTKDEGIFRNPSEIVTPRVKQRRKPEPLKIPASVSTAYQTNHPAPGSPPYTPPPMLSPRSLYSHVNAAGSLTPRSGIPQLPMTPSRLLLSSRSCRSSIDTGGDTEEVVFPEPKINVGSHFQAKIPDRVLPREMAKNDVHKATMVWNLLDEKKKGRTQEIQAFLEMSASCAIHGGGSNKEYALHILQKTRGNIKDAVKLILSKKYVIPPTDPMHDYHYEGSVKWSARERQTFRNAFRSKSKDFNDLQKEIRTKSVADCIEFYYLWKANNPEAVRGRTRYVDSDSEDDYEDDTGSETNSNPSLFECDFPHCSAKFVSRQALNGHIRVHGGSFMKPNEPRKRRAPATTTNQDAGTEVVKRPRKPYVPQPMPQPLVEGGPLPEYACKVCGRIFHKIKSRSAHMKTHVKRPDDDHKHNVQH